MHHQKKQSSLIEQESSQSKLSALMNNFKAVCRHFMLTEIRFMSFNESCI